MAPIVAAYLMTHYSVAVAVICLLCLLLEMRNESSMVSSTYAYGTYVARQASSSFLNPIRMIVIFTIAVLLDYHPIIAIACWTIVPWIASK